jgi:undecaprenyl-diphosphatase
MCTISFFFYLLVGLSVFLESFPISSSGHILLVQQLLERCCGVVCTLNENIEYFLHGPNVIILAIFFYNRWKLLLIALFRNFSIIKKIMMLGFITDSITASAYFLFFKHATFMPLWVGFLITSSLLFSLYFCKKNPTITTSWNYKNACILGMVQACALMPGISRFGSTFVTARWLGFPSKKSFELSFLIEFPISVAAALMGGYSLYSKNMLHELLHPMMTLVIIIAAIGSLLGLWIMQRIISYNYMWSFSLYLLINAILSAVI